MKEFLLYLHQLPQNVLGFFLTRKGCYKLYVRGIPVYYKTGFFHSGISLGKYIIMDSCNQGSVTSVMHEHGHQKQSLYLGWLYLVIVGLPSLLGNIWDRIAHSRWEYSRRCRWYYSRFPENWADSLGGVKRSYK